MKKSIQIATMVVVASMAAAMFGSAIAGIIAGFAQYGFCRVVYDKVDFDED